MSVINQMLKDLEQRQGEQQVDNAAVMPVIATKSPFTNMVIVVATVLITLAAVYMYYLHTENQRLASQSSQQSSQKNSLTETVLPKVEQVPVPVIETKLLVANNSPTTPVVQQTVTAEHSSASTLPLVSAPKSKVEQSKVEQRLVESSRIEVNQSKQPSTMVITRKRLTPETLAKQKMSRAKEAVANNNIAKAEQLFEDVLLVLPTNKDARKQLAALWFGRQSYQAALNLLSQGIHLEPTDSELRLLKAQIHIKQQQHGAAFQILQSHPKLREVTDIKYQSMLATQAQKSKQYQFAAQAYQRLTKLQNANGRWWLGLAIAYDSDSQFKLARQTYHTALNKQDLSSSARAFVEQRLQELGE